MLKVKDLVASCLNGIVQRRTRYRVIRGSVKMKGV